jgi:hypothetical protein
MQNRRLLVMEAPKMIACFDHAVKCARRHSESPAEKERSAPNGRPDLKVRTAVWGRILANEQEELPVRVRAWQSDMLR